MGTADDVARLIPKSNAVVAAEISNAAVTAEAARLLAEVSQFSIDDAKAVTKAACTAKELLGLNSIDEAVNFAIQQLPTTAGRRAQVQSLTEELEKAETSGEGVQILAVAAACQWADAD